MDALHLPRRLEGRLIALAARLGLSDLLRERTAFLCQVFAMAAVLAPLLILYGLKYGLITTLTQGLAADADVRQITIKGVGDYSESLLAELESDPLVGFVAPHPHPINADTFFAVAGERGAPTFHGTILGSGPGDPLLGSGLAPPAPDETVLSAGLARDMNVAAGDRILVLAERNQGEVATLPVTVVGVLSPAAWPAQGALLHPDSLMAVDRWSEGYLVLALGESGRPLTRPTIPTFRLFASDIFAVQPLADALTARGINVATQVRRIEALQRLALILDVVFSTIAVVAGLGYLFSFSANLWANVSRKQRDLSILRLQGLDRRAAVAFPAAQALAIGLAGWLVATLLYLLAASLINDTLGQDFARALGEGFLGGAIARDRVPDGELALLEAHHHLLALGLCLLVALAAAAAAAKRIMKIDPAEGMRLA